MTWCRVFSTWVTARFFGRRALGTGTVYTMKLFSFLYQHPMCFIHTPRHKIGHQWQNIQIQPKYQLICNIQTDIRHTDKHMSHRQKTCIQFPHHHKTKHPISTDQKQDGTTRVIWANTNADIRISPIIHISPKNPHLHESPCVPWYETSSIYRNPSYHPVLRDTASINMKQDICQNATCDIS